MPAQNCSSGGGRDSGEERSLELARMAKMSLEELLHYVLVELGGNKPQPEGA
jgi:hypothetical protein